jgi:membrane protease YdiL (CAAX protease family)
MTEAHGSPFWTYEDLALFLAAILPSSFLGVLLVCWSGTRSAAAQTLIFQSSIYLLLLGALYLLIALRYGQPFWRSLAWARPVRGGWICVAGAPPLAIATSILGALLHAPDVPNQIEGLISNRASLIIVMLFVVLFGPVWEELLFRGFLFPLLARTFGAWPGIILTAVPFALLHGGQNRWAWQQMVAVGLAGVAFGYARYRTGSTAAAAILHCGYNTTLFVAYLVQRTL